jgi:shikimate kinase
VWLRVSAEEAVRRAQAAGGRERPLLAVETPLERARELLGEREPYYGASRWTVDTEGRSPVEVCEEIEALMLDSAGAREPR